MRSRPPSKNACGSSPVHIFSPRPRLHKRLHASHPQFCNSRVLSDVFFVPAILYTHVFCIFSSFFTNLLPALGGEHDFASGMCVKSSKNVPLSTPIYPKNAKLGTLIAIKNLQIPLEKQAFPVRGLSWVCISCTSALPCLLALLAAPFSFKI